MKKILFTLMMLAAASATMSAQDEPMEKTATPTVSFESGESYMQVTIVDTDDCGATVYCHFYKYPDEYYFDDSFLYMQSYVFQDAGDYIFEVYAKAQDKLASDTVTYGFSVSQNIISTTAHDFIVDGIYYKIQRDSTIWVSTRAIDECTNDWDYQPHATDQCYSGDVIIPSSVEYDGKTYPVTGIATYAFENCNLNSVYLPNSILSIWDYAFYGCTGLKVITLPESVTLIEQLAFRWCSDLKTVICKAVTPPNAFGTAFSSNYAKATLYVPFESLEAYQNHASWGRFTHIVPFIGAGPGDINGDGSVAISDATNLIDMLLGGDELPAWADVDGDGAVGIKDVTTLIDMLLGN